MSSDAGLRRLFRENIRDFDWLSIETGTTSRGVPDANFCCEGIEGWVEFKATDYWKVVIKPEQVGWAARRIRHGGRVFLAIRRARVSLWLYSGGRMIDLMKHRLDDIEPIGIWHGGAAKWDWKEVRGGLLRPI